MAKKPRSPSQIAQLKVEKKTYSFSLHKANTERLKKLAEDNNVNVSDLIDEAIIYYLDVLKDQQNN